LSDPVQRMVYDEIHGYALTAINPFLDDTATKDHAFVDEFTCIGNFIICFFWNSGYMWHKALMK
jgi:hypothetical protein